MIDFVAKYNIQHLAPSHSRHIIGHDKILNTLNVYHDGISYWLEEKYDIENKGGGNFSDIIMERPMMWSIKTLPFPGMPSLFADGNQKILYLNHQNGAYDGGVYAYSFK